MRLAICAVVVLGVCAGAAMADEVKLSNGDRLTGTITEIAGGKLKIKTALAGDVVVDTKDVVTFSTDNPVTLKLKDGQTVERKVAASATKRGMIRAGFMPR